MRRDERRVLTIMLAFVGVFAVLFAGFLWHRATVVQPGATWFPKTKTCQVPPGAACEAAGNWWDPVSKTCAHVVDVRKFTGRP